MPGTAGPQNPAASAVDVPSRAAPPARTAAGIGRRAWEEFADNPLQALLGTAIVALLSEDDRSYRRPQPRRRS